MNRIFSVILLRFWKWRVLCWNKDAMFLQVNVFLSGVCTDDLRVCISVLQSAVIGLDLIESPPLCYLHRYWSNQLSLIAATLLHLWMADYYCIFSVISVINFDSNSILDIKLTKFHQFRPILLVSSGNLQFNAKIWLKLTKLKPISPIIGRFIVLIQFTFGPNFTNLINFTYLKWKYAIQSQNMTEIDQIEPISPIIPRFWSPKSAKCHQFQSILLISSRNLQFNAKIWLKWSELASDFTNFRPITDHRHNLWPLSCVI